MDSFPISPSDLTWWQWLFVAAGLWSVAFIAFVIWEDTRKGGCIVRILGVLTALAGLICALIGLIRFVKWVRGS